MVGGPTTRQKVGTLPEMRERCWEWIEREDGTRVVAGSVYNRFLLRPISLRLTRCFVGLGISANQATLLMILAGWAGLACAVPHSPLLTVLAGVCWFAHDLFDAVDGEIARWNRSATTRGLFLDKMAHLLVDHPSLAAAALHAYFLVGNNLYLLLGVIAALASVTARAARETMLRINAEVAREDQPNADADRSGVSPRSPNWFVRFCRRLNEIRWLGFPVTKARIVHLLSLAAIGTSYLGTTAGLVMLAWFYAVYTTLRLALEIPYFYAACVTDVPHRKKTPPYRWPL